MIPFMEIEMSCIRKNKKVCQTWAVDNFGPKHFSFSLRWSYSYLQTDTQANHLFVLMLYARYERSFA